VQIMQIGVALGSMMQLRTVCAILFVLLGCGGSPTPGDVATAAAVDAASRANASATPGLAGLADGSFTVTPANASHTFATAARRGSIRGASVTSANFSAKAFASGSGSAGAGCTGTAPPILAGTQTLEPIVDTNSLGQAEAFQVTGGACGVVSSLNLYVDASSTAGTIVVGLYTDNAGSPGSLLTQGSIMAPVAGAWNTITVPAVSVAAGTPYWIAVLGTTSGTVAFRDAPSGCVSETSASTTLTSLPSNWTAGTSYPSCPLSAYAAPSATTISTYSISGALSPSSDAVGSVMTLSGAASATTTPVASGSYSFTGLANGNYTVSSSNPAYSFTPASEAVTINNANVTAVNFSATAPATAPTYSISGTISPASDAAGSVVALSGAASAKTTPNASGVYSFTGLASGNYTVTPTSQSASFSPASEPVTVSGASSSAVNFSATATTNTIFYDDFTGTSLSSAWTIIQRHGEYSQGETECNTRSGVSVLNSVMSITTSAVAANCGDYPVPAGTYPAYPGTAASSWPYTTGDIQWTNFNFTFGTITFHAKFPPSNTHTWPGIWLLGANCQATNILTGNTSYNGAAGVGNCPNFSANYAEEDLVECAVNEAGAGTWCHFAYWGGGSFGFCNINLDANWHLFQFVWNSTSITEYLDGTQVCQITARATLQIPQQPMFLIIQTQTGGVGATPDNANLPTTLQVDYVKVTQP
jgi:Glycosyl hydrolases family 16